MSQAHNEWMDWNAPTRRRTFEQAMKDDSNQLNLILQDEDAPGYVTSRMRLEAQRRSAEDARLDAIGRGTAGNADEQSDPLTQAMQEAWAEEEAEKREVKQVDTATIEIAVRMILEAISEDLSRPDVRETPARVARFYKEFIGYQPGTVDTSFADEHVCDQMVTVSGVRVWSLCAHHMLPFYVDIAMGYIANGNVLGLSKFARIAHKVAHGLQTQEKIATQIADELERVTGTRNVAVLCEKGLHTCATMRGIKTPLSMNNAVMRGVFFLRPTARTEFYNLIRRS